MLPLVCAVIFKDNSHSDEAVKEYQKLDPQKKAEAQKKALELIQPE